MHHENLFNILVGKYDILLWKNTPILGLDEEVAPYDTDPKNRATYAEVIDLVSQAKYEEGLI